MKRWLGLAVALAGVYACDSSTTFAPVSTVQPFVGTWDAVVFRVTAEDPPHTIADVLSLGPFWISIEPSGRYIATLEFFGGQVEFGQLTVHTSSRLTLDPDNGPAAPSDYVFATADSVVLDGSTDFDFNLDGTTEAAQAHIEIVRR